MAKNTNMLSPSRTELNNISDDETSMSSTCSPQWRTAYNSRPTISSPYALQPVVNSKQTSSVGLSDPALSELRRKKLETVNRLHNIGTQRDIDLPSIVVIGSQSTGKSSLIESISGISLPRSSGTCTRCPTECRLVRTSLSETWQCNVSLQFLTDEQGRPLDTAKNIPFGPTIRNPKDVEERLRRAQLAVLNPSVNPQMFLNGTYQAAANFLNFSTNTVCLEIKGPDLTDLSFCDLPGLIASVGDGGRDEDVEQVQELVAAYIQKPSCIILLTVACEVDFETQGAYRLAKKYDPEGVRTIGVLTKPDRIPEGEHSRWFRLIHNESSPLQNGWFCVKQLSSAELDKGYSFDENRRICENFFKKDPWTSLDSICQKRLGTKAVTAKLNEFLMAVISKRIPEIMQELQDLIQEAKEKIQSLPPSPSPDAILEMMHLINEFCDTLYNHSKGFYTDDDDKLDTFARSQFEEIRKEHAKFRMAIQATAPKFAPCIRPVTDGLSDPSLEGLMYPDDITGMITRAVTRELPGYSPFHVVQDLISLSTEKWKIPVFDCVKGIFFIVTEHQMKLVRTHFERYTAGGLYHTVKNIVYGYMQKRKEMLEQRLQWLLKLESHAFTLNDFLFLEQQQQCLKKYDLVRETLEDEEGDKSTLRVMSTVEAYFEVAYRRFIDNISLAIDHELVRIDKRPLQEVLCKGLKLTDPSAQEICGRLMSEPTHVSQLREELRGRLERLSAAQAELIGV